MIQIKTTKRVADAVDQSKQCKELAMQLMDENQERDAARMLLDSVELCIQAAGLSMEETGGDGETDEVAKPLFLTNLEEEKASVSPACRKIVTMQIKDRLNAHTVHRAIEAKKEHLEGQGPFMMIWDLTEASLTNCTFSDVCQMTIVAQSVVDFLSPESVVVVKSETDSTLVRLWHHWMKEQLSHTFHIFTDADQAKSFARCKVSEHL